VSRALARIGSKLPQGWGDAGRQIGILVGVDTAYELVRGIADGQRSEAIAHGQQVIEFEQTTHTLFEPGLQAFLVPAHWLVVVANQLYLNAQFSIALGFLVWLYLFRNDSYYFVRNMFVVSMGLALVGYTLYPTAPPRMFPEHGFIDTIVDYSNVNHDSTLAKVFINPYAAIPSMHCAFAAMIGVTGVRVCRNWWSKAWWAAWPLLIAWVVVVTGNHYWLDVALGWMVAPPRVPSSRRNGQELRAYARERLIESRLTPNAISIAGLVGNLIAAVLVTQRLFFLAGVAFVVGSVMDTLDGRYSRMSGKGTLFGAFLDSTLDRIEEGIVLAAVAGYFAATGQDFAAAMCVVAVLGSLMVSYTRARAEALGVECKVGLATRPVRVVILSIGLVFAKGAGLGDFELLAPAVYVIAALTIVTTIQRVWHVRNQLSTEANSPPDL
jgi:phosphatidylinositol phosphate synthase